MVKRKLAQAAGATLGFIHGNVPGAVAGYSVGGRAYDASYPVEDVSNNPFLGPKRRKLSTFTKKIMAVARRPRVRRVKNKRSKMGKKSLKTRKRKTIAKRKVKQTRRKSKKVKPTMSTATKLGFTATFETYGGVSDPNTCYIIHSTYSRIEYARTIVGAIYRKLFKKAGILVADIHTELPMSSIVDSTGFRLVAERRAVVGTQNTIEYDFADNLTFQGLVSGFTLLNDYILALLDGSTTIFFTKLMLYTKDEAKYRVHTVLNMETEVLHLIASSTLKVQNRTRGDQATGAGEGDYRVDDQILEAKVYNFNNACPKLKSLSTFNHEWSTLSANGMDLIRAAEFPQLDYQNLPPKALWSNCSNVTKYMHTPGVVKLMKVYWTKSGLFNDVVQKFEPHMTNGTLVSGLAGKSQMLGVEELIRSDSANLVQLKYERKYQCGAFLTTHKTPAAVLTDLSYVTQNQYAP